MNAQCTDRFSPGKEVVIRTVVINGVKYTGSIRGRLKSVEGESAIVDFRVPVNPSECASCNSPFNLSRNGATGEVTCMRSGCGHSHGFQVVSVDSLKLSSLIPADEFDRSVLEEMWREKLKLRRREVEWANNALKEVLEEGTAKGWKE